jgi:hypothetical protein
LSNGKSPRIAMEISDDSRPSTLVVARQCVTRTSRGEVVRLAVLQAKGAERLAIGKVLPSVDVFDSPAHLGALHVRHTLGANTAVRPVDSLDWPKSLIQCPELNWECPKFRPNLCYGCQLGFLRVGV